MQSINCKYYLGNKPCRFHKKYGVLCKCRYFEDFGKKILIIKIGAKGDVLRTTPILTSIKRAYPKSFITWVTDKEAMPLLENNKLIDAILPYDTETVARLMTEEFDIVYSLDKEHKASGLAMIVKSKEKKGSGLSKYGNCYPLDKEADYWFQLGLNDKLKFKINKKTYHEWTAEAVGLPYDRKKDRIIFNLTKEEKEEAKKLLKKDSKKLVGINPGCNPNFLPNRRWSTKNFAKLIDAVDANFVLFGGKSEIERNNEIIAQVKNKGRIIDMTNKTTLRQLGALIDLCDVIASTVSLAVNIAFALNKYTVVLIGQTEPAEIDIYDRGAIVVTKAKCAPCYRNDCKKTECIDKIDFNDVLEAVKRGLNK